MPAIISQSITVGLAFPFFTGTLPISFSFLRHEIVAGMLGLSRISTDKTRYEETICRIFTG
jgi:hypothetical protein